MEERRSWVVEDSRQRTEARRKATAFGLPFSVISHQAAP
jgi:hypothetical protein